MTLAQPTSRPAVAASAVARPVIRRPWLASSIALLAIIGMLALYAASVGQAAWEAEVLREQQQLSPPGATYVAEAFTDMGDSSVYLLIVVVAAPLFLWMRRHSLAALMVAAYMLRFVAPVTKELVGRPRPSPELVDVADRLATPAFPSGHVLSATLVFGCLLYAVDLCVPNVRLRRTLQAGMVAVIGLMGLARMELGEHWLTDVLGGWAIGALLLIMLTQLERAHRRRRSATAAVAAG